MTLFDRRGALLLSRSSTMDASLQNHIAYLEVRLGACQPAKLHPRQIAAYRNLIAVARETGDGLEYQRRTRNLFELIQAEWIDRYENFARVHRALGEVAKLRAAEAAVAAAKASTATGQLQREVITAKSVHADAVAAEDRATSAVPGLVFSLLGWKTDFDPESKAERLAGIRAYLTQLRVDDPEISWARVCDHQPYRDRLPFCDAALEEIGTWYRTAAGELGIPTSGAAPAAAPPAIQVVPDDEDDDILPLSVPTAAQIAAAYRAAYAATDPKQVSVRAVYEKLFELAAAAGDDGNALMYEMAKQSVFVDLARAQLLTSARQTADSVSTAHQPLAAGHYARLAAALELASSPTEVELIQLEADAVLAIESAWATTLWAFATKPMLETLQFEADPRPERRRAITECDRINGALFGHSFESLLAVPAAWTVLGAEWAASAAGLGTDESAGRIVQRGEVALELAAAARANELERAIGEVAAAGGDPEGFDQRLRKKLATGSLASPEAMRANLIARHREIVGESAAAMESDRPLVFWNRTVELAELHELLPDPPRPDLRV